MKKRILSLVLCAAMLLSMAVLMGAGMAADAPDAEGFVPAVNFTNVAPFGPAVTGVSPLRARSVTPLGLDDGTTGSDKGMVINKTATANSNGTYTIQLEAYATGSKVITEVKEDIPTDIVLVLDQSGSMADCIVCGKEIGRNSTHTVYTYTAVYNPSTRYDYYIIVDGNYIKLSYDNDDGSGWWSEDDSYTGWYYMTGSRGNQTKHEVSHKTSESDSDPSHVQFYTRTGTEEACTSRLDALKTALNNFTAAVNAKAAGADGRVGTADDVNHRIAMVGFASKSGYGDNTKLLSISGSNSGSVGIAYNSIKTKNYKAVMQDMDTVAGQTMVQNAINALAASGATRADLGMKMAQNILDNNPLTTGEKRNRVVVMFTDGSPTSSNGFEVNVANNAIATAETIKTTCGATVYSVGVFAGANANSAGTKPNDDLSNNSPDIPAASNWFMQNVSSNNGTVQNPSYYLSASDSAALNNIFQQISNNIETGGSSSTLTAEAVVKDVISPQFALPKGATAADITLKTYACTGKDANGKLTFSETANDDAMGATATVDGSNVSVTGFNFSGNWCGTETSSGGETHHGNKLVISFTVSPKAGFLGGNNVYTNDSAGVYVDSAAETPLLTFDRPTVNVPIKPVSVTAESKNVYLLGNLTADQLRSGATVEVGDVSLNLSKENYGLKAWQTAYVNIEVTIKDEDGKDVPTAGLSSLTGDTTYTVTVKVTPKTEATDTTTSGAAATEQSGSKSANVNVYKPVLTYKDSESYYGDTAPDFTGNLTATVWKHGETEANTDVMGAAPALTLTYTPDTDAVVDGKINTRTDFGVAAAVMIGETNVTANTTFKHTPCEGKTCTLPDGTAFLCHVNTCSLKITKTVEGKGANSNQTFVFDVKDSTGKLVTTIVLKDGEQKTITGLAVGTYTVTEDTNWSWSYSIVGDNNRQAALSSTMPGTTVDVTNHYNSHNWLTSIADVINTWISGSAAQKN